MNYHWKISGCIQPSEGKRKDLEAMLAWHDIDYLVHPSSTYKIWQNYCLPDMIAENLAPLVQTGTIDAVTFADNSSVICEKYKYVFADNSYEKILVTGETA